MSFVDHKSPKTSLHSSALVRVLTLSCLLISSVFIHGCDSSPNADPTNSAENAANHNDNNGNDTPEENPPQDNPSVDDTAEPPPPPGVTRAGQSYAVKIAGASEQDVLFQVLEPQTFSGDTTYPLVLHVAGFGNARARDYEDEGVQNVGNIKLLTENGYGVISVDMRGHGESGGQIRVDDPDAEIQDVILVLDWVDNNLDWVTRRFDADAAEENIVLGAVGASYGGQVQLLLQAVDPKKRLDAMVPSNTWSDLSQALVTNDVYKSGWAKLLFGAGNNAGDRFNFDPFVSEILLAAESTNRMPDDGMDFLRYHSFDYFCDGNSVATNGGPGTSPQQAATPPSPIPTLFTQGLRDTLFTFNDALANYRCMRAVGANDVRMITYNAGHNTLFPGPGVIYQNPQPSGTDRHCASFTYDQAMLAFLDEHLKLQNGRIDNVFQSQHNLGPDDLCLSLDVNNAIIVDIDSLKIGGTAFTFTDAVITPTQTTADTATVVASGQFFAGQNGDVIAGIPTTEITLSTVSGLGADPIVFIGIGHRRASGNGQGVWDTIDNQVTPIRGAGTHNIELTAIAEQLQPGDELAILLFGAYPTHATSATRDALSASMNLSGTISLPILATSEYRQAN